jgi:hypothetical protein
VPARAVGGVERVDVPVEPPNVHGSVDDDRRTDGRPDRHPPGERPVGHRDGGETVVGGVDDSVSILEFRFGSRSRPFPRRRSPP